MSGNQLLKVIMIDWEAFGTSVGSVLLVAVIVFSAIPLTRLLIRGITSLANLVKWTINLMMEVPKNLRKKKAYDDFMRYKTLRDEGIISQEEFELKTADLKEKMM